MCNFSDLLTRKRERIFVHVLKYNLIFNYTFETFYLSEKE